MATFGFVRNIVRNLIQGFGGEFKSASSFLDFAKSEGLGYRRATFLSDWRELVTGATKRTGLKFVRKDRTPSMKVIEETRRSIQNKFQVIGQVTFTNALTGQTETKKVSFLTGGLKSRGAMEETILDIASSSQDKYAMGDIKKVTLSSILTPM